MTEKPILFSGEMVRAILDGRKTQTRRVINPRESRWEVSDDGMGGPLWPYWPCYVYGEPDPVEVSCPYGKVGDMLWVRETWAPMPKHRPIADPSRYDGVPAFYKADCDRPMWAGNKWKPSIHMPRWASRINLRVTDVRVERVQDISVRDAIAEGYPRPVPTTGQAPVISWFLETWNSINANRKDKAGRRLPYAWDDNPWVWCVSFERVE